MKATCWIDASKPILDQPIWQYEGLAEDQVFWIGPAGGPYRWVTWGQAIGKHLQDKVDADGGTN